MSDMTVSDDLLREVVESVSGGDASVRNLLGLMMARELIKLRDQLRWRKWPEEKPEVEQHCQLILANNSFPHLCCSIYPFAHWENLNATHWRPIGPLPKEIE